MKINIVNDTSDDDAIVITPSINHKFLETAIQSVQSQSFLTTKHLIVFDGIDDNDYQIWKSEHKHLKNIESINLTQNTGKNGFYGHRIYAGFPFLLNQKYIFFLDEDNWYEKNHIESCIKMMQQKNFDWVYSLRNICSIEGNFLTEDNCESLGKWPIYFSIQDSPRYLVDTSCYSFKRSFLTNVCHQWNSGWGGDRRFYEVITKGYGHTNYGPSGYHTLNYRLDENIKEKYGSIDDFFIKGNELMNKHYNGKLPWKIENIQ